MTLTHQLGEFPQTLASPEVIDLGLGQPSPSLLPLAAFGEAAAASLTKDADPLLLQYGAIAGYEGFRRALATLLTELHQFPVVPAELLVTAGISSALAWVGQVLASPGGTVACGDPTYFLAPGIFQAQHLTVVPVPVDEHGLHVEQLERELEMGLTIDYVYCIPSFQNPSGVNLAPARAQRLVDLAEVHGFVVIADEPYTALHFGPAPPPVMMRYDRGRGRVVSLGSFSKLLGPGLRLGWAHAAPELIGRLAGHGALRSGGGLNPIVSALVHALIDRGFVQTHIAELRRTYAQRAKVLVDALREHLPTARFATPQGGYFVWVDLGPDIDTTRLQEHARANHGVSFTPGSRCALRRDASTVVRLSFAFYGEAELAEGVVRLASAVRTFRAGQSQV